MNNVQFETVIGIEVHAQLLTKTKLFSTASTEFGQAPNTNVTPVCLGMPGALPVLNKKAVELAVRAGLALGCRINQTSIFARKNYFYPDLPKGYQISQFDRPLCEAGSLTVDVDGTQKTVGITRIHMEEDAGKLLHQGADGIAGSSHSLVDLNRAGTALIEIVSEPDIRSAAEARAYVEGLRELVVHLGICDGNMEEGSLRADANVSIRPMGAKEFGTRAEIKNLNSFRSLERAILVEVERQKKIVLSGGKVVQETRNYDDNLQITTSLRSKEDAHDYRYFPEPDLPPLVVSTPWLEAIKASMPELPGTKRKRYSGEMGLGDNDVHVLMSDSDIDRYFHAAIASQPTVAPKEIAKWVVGDVNALFKDKHISFAEPTVSAARLGEMVALVQDGTISGKMAKDVLLKLFESDGPVKNIVEAMGGGQISDEAAIAEIVKKVVDANPDTVDKIKAGKTQVMGFLVGQVMKESKGKANPEVVNKLIMERVQS